MTKKIDMREVDTRDCIRVVTSNDFLKIEGLADLSLNALKLLYFAISQCKKDDDIFYSCIIKEKELAKCWGITKQTLYDASEDITKELSDFVIRKNDLNQYNYIRKFNVPMFGIVVDDFDSKGNKIIQIALNPFANELFLHLDKNFSQPLLCDFNKMKSVNSILIWHLIQVKLKSIKPGGNKIVNTRLSVNELRVLTNNITTYPDLKDFKKKVINQAIKDIKRSCNINVTCKSVKEGRNVIAYDFFMSDKFYIPEDQLSDKTKNAIIRAENFKKKKLTNI